MSTDYASSTTGASVARGSLWEIAGQVLPQIYVFIVSAATARYLGASVFGLIALISGVQLAVTSIVTWGIPYALIRTSGELYGSGRSSQLRSLMRWAYRVVAAASAIAFVATAGAVVAGAHPRSVWVLAGLTAAAAVLHSVPSSFLIGAQRFRQARIMGILTGTVSAGAKVVALATGHGIVAIFAIELAVVLANLIGTGVLAHHYQRDLGHDDVQPGLKRDVFRFAAIVGVSTVVGLVVYQRTEIFVLAHYRTDTDIARYSVPYSMVTTLLLLPSAASTVLSPAVATLWGARDLDRIRSGVSRSLRLVLLMTITLAGILSAVGPSFIRVVFGPSFSDVRTILIVLALGLPVVPVGTISSSVLRALGTLRWLTIWGVTGAIANVVLAFALIKPFGAVGAAAANSSAQMAVALPLLVIVRRRVGSVDMGLLVLLRTMLLVGLGTAAAIVTVAYLPLAARVPVGALVFGVIVFGGARPFRIMSRDDAGWITELLAGRGRGWPAAFARYASGWKR